MFLQSVFLVGGVWAQLWSCLGMQCISFGEVFEPHSLPQTFQRTLCLASSPGPTQTLSRSRGEKLGEGLGSKLRHGPEMVDSVSTNQVHITYKPSPPFPVRDIVLIPGLLPIFLHGCEIKSGWGLGTRLRFAILTLCCIWPTIPKA